jgi:hypothetical protein
MRKFVAVLAAAGMAAALSAAPAVAGGGKHVHGTVSGTLLPFPNLSSHTGTTIPGCAAGQEGVHWTGQELKAPGKGTLKFSTSGFTGDHDLYVFNKDMVAIARSDNEQVGPTMAPPEEEISLPMKKGDTVLLVACNWMGQPNVEATYEGHFK